MYLILHFKCVSPKEISSRDLEMSYNIKWIKENMLEEFFDFNGDGKIDFNDIVALFKTG